MLSTTLSISSTMGPISVAYSEGPMEKPLCKICAKRHWGSCAAPKAARESQKEMAPLERSSSIVEPDADEVARALRFYRAHRVRQKLAGQRRRVARSSRS